MYVHRLSRGHRYKGCERNWFRVYFIQCGGPGGPVKIGSLGRGSIEGRILSLQTGCPYELRALAVVRATRGGEQHLHGKFKQYRIRGEWFRPAEPIMRLAERIDRLSRRSCATQRVAAMDINLSTHPETSPIHPASIMPP